MNTQEIGANAGVVWRLLSAKGKLSLSDIMTLTGLPLPDLSAAIGWLAREGKVNFTIDNGRELYSVFREYYY